MEIRDLSLHYQEVERSIKTIQSTIKDLSTDALLVEVKKLSNFLTTDMSEMSQTINYITQNYDSSFAFFQSFEENLDKVKEVYVGYKLHFLVYSGLGLIGVLVVIKIISVVIKIALCYPLVKDFISDFSAFRAQRQTQRNEAYGDLNRPCLSFS